MLTPHRIAPLMLILVLAPLGCSGGAMNEVESEAATGGSEPAAAESTPPAATNAPAETSSPTAAAQPSTPAAEPAAPYVDPDVATYQQRLTEAVQGDWDRPGRDSRTTPRRIGVVVLHLGPDGRLERWNWQRRSPDGPFNASVSSLLDGLIASGRELPLAPMRGGVRARLAEEGVAIEFADE